MSPLEESRFKLPGNPAVPKLIPCLGTMPARSLHRMRFVAAILISAGAILPLASATDNPPWQDGRVTDVEELDARHSDRSDPTCAALRAQIYTVETDKQILKMLGNLGTDFTSGDRRAVRFYVDKNKHAHILGPGGRPRPITLIVYQSEWRAPASVRPASTKRKSRSWQQATVKGVEPLLIRLAAPPFRPYRGPSCSVSRPVGWTYIVELGGITYDAVWKKRSPLDLRAREETSVAWKGSDKIYLMDDGGKERTLPVKERRQPPPERAARGSPSAPK